MSNNKKYTKKKEKNTEKEPIIHVSINIRSERVAVINRKNVNDYVHDPFRGATFEHPNQKTFSRKYLKHIKSELMKDYKESHPNASPEKLKAISKLVDKNVNLNIYHVLKKYDNNHFWKAPQTHKAENYLKAMTTNFKVKTGESKKEYKQRVLKERNRMLDKAGISCDFNLTGSIFSLRNVFDRIKVLRMAAKAKNTSHIVFHNTLFANKNSSIPFNDIEEFGPKIREPNPSHVRAVLSSLQEKAGKIKLHIPKVEMPNREKILETTRKLSDNVSQLSSNIKKETNKRYTAAKGLFQSLQEKVRQNDFKKQTKLALLSAGICSLGLLTVAGIAIHSNNTTAKEANIDNSSSDYTIIFETPNKFMSDIEMIIDDTKKEETIVSDSKTVERPVMVAEQAKEDTNVVAEEAKMVVFQDALFETINVKLDGIFKGPESGRYYSSPEGAGNFGNYDSKKENLTVKYIDVFEANGGFKTYKLTDGKSISDIKALHPGATLSYCIFTESGKNLGWNPATDNNIETYILKGAILKLKPYLSARAMQFLCDTDLQSTVDENKIKDYLEEIRQASTKLELQNQLQNSNNEIER